jgi:hypothetical protein
MAAAHPQVTRKKLGGPDFGVAQPPHFAPDVVFQRSINGEPARMPKHHPRCVVLDVPKFELVSKTPMIEFVHALCSRVEGRGADGKLRKEKAPSVAGGAHLVVAGSAYRSRPVDDPPGVAVAAVSANRKNASIARL